MGRENYVREYFESVVKRSINVMDTARNLGISTRCGNRNTIKKFIKKYEIDTSHFYIPRGYREKPKTLEQLLVSGSPVQHTTNLKNKLYNAGLKERNCEICGQGEDWMGMKISLVLDHENGDNTDYRLVNLRILCPNCNAWQPTFCRGKKGMKNTSMMESVDVLVSKASAARRVGSTPTGGTS